MKINPNVAQVAPPPIAEAVSWLDDIAPRPGRPIIDVAQAVPSYPPANELTAFLSEAIRDPASAFYTPIMGLPELRQALAGDISERYHADMRAADIGITAGANHAYCLATLAVAGPGDEILLAAPYYFNHQMWFAMQEIHAVPLPCHPGPGGLFPDVTEAASLVGERTQAIALVSPNNPTGTVLPPDLLSDFFDLVCDQGIALIIDETYRDFLPDGPPHDLFTRSGWRDHLIHLYSFSKAYSLTGYRVGGLAAGAGAMAAIEKIADTMTICPPHIGQLAAIHAIGHLRPWARARRDDMATRATALDAAFDRHRPAFELISRGAFFAYLRLPNVSESDVELAKRIVAEQSVLLLPGSFFGSDQNAGYLRVAFANIDEEQIDDMVRRLKEFAG